MQPQLQKYIDRLCADIKTGRFNWQNYTTPKNRYGRVIYTQPCFSSYGQIGFEVICQVTPGGIDTFPVVYDWEWEQFTYNKNIAS